MQQRYHHHGLLFQKMLRLRSSFSIVSARQRNMQNLSGVLTVSAHCVKMCRAVHTCHGDFVVRKVTNHESSIGLETFTITIWCAILQSMVPALLQTRRSYCSTLLPSSAVAIAHARSLPSGLLLLMTCRSFKKIKLWRPVLTLPWLEQLFLQTPGLGTLLHTCACWTATGQQLLVALDRCTFLDQSNQHR